MLPPFEIVSRSRPIQLIGREHPGPFSAPFAAVEMELGSAVSEERPRIGFITDNGTRLLGWFDRVRRRAGIEVVSSDGRTGTHQSRRHGRASPQASAFAVTVTGQQLTVLVREREQWMVRGRFTLERAPVMLRVDDPARDVVRSGTFGQLGLRDLHLVTESDGRPVERGNSVFVSATHAGPGFFDTAHTGIWELDRATLSLRHTADLFFRRDGRVFGDHATHVCRHEGSWIVATSTWGDFDHDHVGLTLSHTSEDVLVGEHILDSAPWTVPHHGVGTWDPHLSLINGRWHLAHVVATRFFEFHPALLRAVTTGSDQRLLHDLELVGELDDRTGTEGAVMTRISDDWHLLISDGRDNPAPVAARYTVLDLSLRERGTLDAPYLSNIPWPMLVPGVTESGTSPPWLLVTFDGTAAGGPGAGYGTHGDIVIMRSHHAQ